MTTERTIPNGYWEDARGALVPVTKIKPVDKDRDALVRGACEEAKKHSATLLGFKLTVMQEIEEFMERSLAEYKVRQGGKKGNVTLTTYSGNFKIIRSMQPRLEFDERLQAAKELIDECVQRWSKGANLNLKVIVNDAFQVDQQGKISTARVLGLRRHDIKDENWLEAMRAIADSTKVVTTKPYIRFYERVDASGEYIPINLDVAAL